MVFGGVLVTTEKPRKSLGCFGGQCQYGVAFVQPPNIGQAMKWSGVLKFHAIPICRSRRLDQFRTWSTHIPEDDSLQDAQQL